ncbi:RNA-binding protein [Photobacterium kishitanii]|uniref:RNA-binding protein n=1 Tax=Photobacterium kishitanii TaxID=318456 RepID=A0A2T3KM13_9GAMM|nr:RNA-binding protein [Photobacterium kishitanii]PSV00731.1 RNA-binding protein [Photobacterium kishitanii]
MKKSNLKSITINVNKRWFNEVKDGIKTEEYRLYNDYWKTRLLNKDGTPKTFKDIKYKLGYPKNGDQSKVLEFEWEGFIVKEITHPHFDNKPETVFAIQLSKRKTVTLYNGK